MSTAMLRIRTGLAAILAVGLLAGCSNDPERGAGWANARAALKALAAARNAPPPSGAPQLTPAQVDGSPIKLLLAVIEADGRGTALGLVSSNSGTETYSTIDGVTITLRDGVMISTRGFAPDLMSAEAPTGRQIAAGDGSHLRRYQILDGDDRTLSPTYECHLRGEGRETLAIAGRSHPTRKVIEVCLGEGTAFENLFWIDNSGKIRQSRQWTGTSVGNLRLSNPQR